MLLDAINVSILQVKKLKFREVKYLAQLYIADKWWTKD